jgi:nucleotide-binding universal stress UspA family protein
MSSEPIVVGTDGSQTAQVAVEKAGELARSLGAKVHVVNSYKPAPGGVGWAAAAGGVPIAGLTATEHERITSEREKERARAEQIVTRARDHLTRLGVEASAHVCSGEPADALITIADAEGAQMIVVGNRGMTGARRVLGSVPNRVSHQAHCGVLIVPTS